MALLRRFYFSMWATLKQSETVKQNTQILNPNSGLEDLRPETLHLLSSKPWRRGLKDLNTLIHLKLNPFWKDRISRPKHPNEVR